MAAIFCIIDGMTDEQWAETQQKLPGWTQLRRQGAYGFLQTTPPGQSADSVGCILRLLGYGSLAAHAWRGWIEALGCGIPFAANDLLLRASWVALDERQCCTGFAKGPLELPAEERGICYYSLGGYKAMLVLRHGAALCARLQTCAPHQHFGAQAELLLPRGIAALTAYVQTCRTAERLLVPWGQSCVGNLPTFSQQAVMVAGCSTALGIGRALQIPVWRPDGATGDVDTALSAKTVAVLQAAAAAPLVILHLNGADEAGHRQDRNEKRAFLQQVDAAVLTPLLRAGHRLLVTADHGCSSETGRHLGDPQPFVLWNAPRRGDLGLLPAEAGLRLLHEESSKRKK